MKKNVCDQVMKSMVYLQANEGTQRTMVLEAVKVKMQEHFQERKSSKDFENVPNLLSEMLICA
jgi:hypothetical protein